MREAEAENQMRECTFTPRTREPPAYIVRMARSMAVARAARPAAPPARPGWR